MPKVMVFIKPHGRQEEAVVQRPAEIEALAERFIAAGGRYTVEPECGNATSYCAEFMVDGETMDIAQELGFDSDPPLVEHFAAFDQVVRDSVTFLEEGEDGRSRKDDPTDDPRSGEELPQAGTPGATQDQR